MDDVARALERAAEGHYIFFREGGWYPVYEPRGDEAIPEHVELNPGTLRVEDVMGRVVWAGAN